MGIFDFCSMTTLFVIVTSIFVIVSVYTYITYKMADQDHKISSMIDLLSSMAQEQEFLRNKLSNKFGENNSTSSSVENNKNKNINLIEVSDDSEEDEDEIDDSTDDTSSDDSDSESDEDNSDDETDDDNKSKFTKSNSINIELETEQSGGTISIEELLDDDEDDVSVSSQLSDATKAPSFAVKSIHLEQIIPITEVNADNLLSVSEEKDNMNYLKSLHLTVPEETDFKKMSVQKLRSIIIEKGFLEDPSKLKKNELLKLIEEKSI